MKILMTIYWPSGFGGAEVSTQLLAEELIKRGHEVIIASTSKYDNIKTYIFKKFRKIPSFWIKTQYLTNFLDGIIKEERVDVVYAQDFLTIKSAILAARKNNRPIFTHIRDYWFACPRSTCLALDLKKCGPCSYKKLLKCFPPKRWVWELQKYRMITSCRKLLKKVDGIFALDECIVDGLRECGITENIKIVENVRDFSKLRKPNKNVVEEFKKKHGLREVVITHVGSLGYFKGVGNLIKIVGPVLKKNENTSLLIVGDGPMKDDILRDVAKDENAFGGRVAIIGHVSRSEMPTVYAASDIVVLPAIWDEPYGAIQLEAGGMGVPVVASNMGGVRISLFGFDVAPFDFKRWRNVLNKLINDEDYRKEVGKEDRELILDDYKVDEYVGWIEKDLIQARVR